MRSIIYYLPACFLVFCLSCEKIPGDKPENIDFNAKAEIVSLTCFPDNTTDLSIRINPVNGNEPYSYKWLSPDTLSGPGPFNFTLSGNLLLKAEVFDADSNKTLFQYEILKDTIDFYKYDYRNRLIGFYDCDVEHRWVTDTSTTNIESYRDTLEVKKSANIRKIEISGYGELSYLNYDFAFDAYHTSATFYPDSIYLYYYETPAGLRNWNFKGKKLY